MFFCFFLVKLGLSVETLVSYNLSIQIILLRLYFLPPGCIFISVVLIEVALGYMLNVTYDLPCLLCILHNLIIVLYMNVKKLGPLCGNIFFFLRVAYPYIRLFSLQLMPT